MRTLPAIGDSADLGARLHQLLYREREVVRGLNARGAFPTKLARLEPRSVFFLANGLVTVRRAERTATAAELIVATLRDTVHVVAFGWRAPRVHLRQMRLF